MEGRARFAVEVHQSAPTSDDVSFDLLFLAGPGLSLAEQGPDLTFLWPSWADTWGLKSTSDMQSWSAVPGTPTDNGSGQMQLTVPFSGPSQFFRLENP